MRIAAVADLHAGKGSLGPLRGLFEHVDERADALLIAGDLTSCGDLEEARLIAKELSGCSLPKVCVLGNHDWHADQEQGITEIMEGAGVRVLDGDGIVVEAGDATLGIAGVKGFGGGFAGASGSEFGEPEMKAFIRHTHEVADGLEAALRALDADVRVALLHYSPTPHTLSGERLEIFPFLGSYLLAEAIDRAGADLVLHGHAHAGVEKGATPGGVPVRNVALPVIGHAYNVYRLGAAVGESQAPDRG